MSHQVLSLPYDVNPYMLVFFMTFAAGVNQGIVFNDVEDEVETEIEELHRSINSKKNRKSVDGAKVC